MVFLRWSIVIGVLAIVTGLLAFGVVQEPTSIIAKAFFFVFLVAEIILGVLAYRKLA